MDSDLRNPHPCSPRAPSSPLQTFPRSTAPSPPDRTNPARSEPCVLIYSLPLFLSGRLAQTRCSIKVCETNRRQMCKVCDSAVTARGKQLVTLLFLSFLPPSLPPSSFLHGVPLERQVNTLLRHNVRTVKWTSLHIQFDGGITFAWVKRRTSLSPQKISSSPLQSLAPSSLPEETAVLIFITIDFPVFELRINVWLLSFNTVFSRHRRHLS